jgi:hypothetical protein
MVMAGGATRGAATVECGVAKGSSCHCDVAETDAADGAVGEACGQALDDGLDGRRDMDRRFGRSGTTGQPIARDAGDARLVGASLALAQPIARRSSAGRLQHLS